MSDAATRQQLRGIRVRLNRLRMPELRTVLQDMNLARTGRKSELVERIALELESCANMARSGAGSHTASSTFYGDQLAVGLASIDRQMSPPHPPPMSSTAIQYTNQIPPVRYTPTPMPPPRGIPPYNRHGLQVRMPEVRPAVSYGGMGSSAVGTTGSGVIPLSSGVDLYNPTKVAALDNARCFCATQGVSGKVVKCVECGLAVHAKCHQLITLTGEWYCEMCRAKSYDPFYRVQKTVLEPNFVRFAKQSSSFRIEYYITDSDLNCMYSKRDVKPGSMTPGSLELQLRCFQVKEDLAAGHCWPACTQLNVNGFGVPITQRAPPGHANPSKVLRELPANIFQFTRVGRNVIDVRTTENPAVFGFMVQIVEVRDIAELVEEVKEASKHLTYESAKQEVIKSFGSEDEDDIVATCTMLSVRCPLGLCVINLPARGLHCKHLQCFDLRTFMLFSKKARSKAWRCTVCHKFIKAADLRIDPYLKQLLADVAGEDELEEVEIFPDGSWKRRVDDELIPVPPAKRVKTEQPSVADNSLVGSGTSASASTTSTSAPAANGGPSASNNSAAGSSAATPFEIDLSLSSDEEEENSIQQTRTMTSTPSVQSAAPASTSSSATILLDDDIDILTVNSDAWDTPARPSGGNNVTSNGDGVDYGDFPFTLDESLFPASSTGSSNTNASSWMSSIVSSMPPPATAVSGAGLTSTATSSTILPPSELMSQPESNLANSMPSISRSHPNAINPFERSQRQTRPPPRPLASQNDLDIICLLDSDSD